ncbi:helix-turn-helix domain-containing protein [Candidatus Avoscillospira sp. LCP25S3_F1]|uniref:helix-turn-helix domain-containing protein n=1 Tax=Candidatus Avoscillospira sp. LCP25S3_F1 TaxID=3438825 RepID=UPI003F927CF8
MAEETTVELLRELTCTDDPAACIRRREGLFIRDTVPSVLTALYRKRTMSKAELARRSGVSQVYLHQVFAGRRTPSRDRLLCLCLGLGASLEETQYLLRVAVSATLWPRSRRDAVVIYGVTHRLTLAQMDQTLEDLGEAPLR